MKMEIKIENKTIMEELSKPQSPLLEEYKKRFFQRLEEMALAHLRGEPMGKFTQMRDYTDEELNEAIAEAEQLFGSEHFFAMLRGIDAYMERRKRIQKKQSYGET